MSEIALEINFIYHLVKHDLDPGGRFIFLKLLLRYFNGVNNHKPIGLNIRNRVNFIF